MGGMITIRHSLIFLTLAILAVSKCFSSTAAELESQHQSFKGVVEDVKQEISSVEQLVSKYEAKLSVARVDLKQAKLRVDDKQRALSDLESNYFESPSEPLKRSIGQLAHGLELAIRGEKSKTKRVSRIEGKLIKSQNVSRMLKQEKGRIIAKIDLLKKEIKVSQSKRSEPEDSVFINDDEMFAQNINEAKLSKLTQINNEQPQNREALSKIVTPPIALNDQKSLVNSEAPSVLTTNASETGTGETTTAEKSSRIKESPVTEDDEKDNVKLKKALKKLSQFRQWR